MKIKYENELKNLQNWISNANSVLISGGTVTIDVVSASNTCQQINIIADGISSEYPFYAVELRSISGNLFRNYPSGVVGLNNAAFGELFIIIRHIEQEPMNLAIWYEVHPRIEKISKGLFCDGYFDSAAEKAVKEVESRLRELFQEVKPGTAVPVKVGDIIGALLTEHGAYQFADLSTVSGRDYRKGIQSLFEGIFSAYRNPASHRNLPCTKRESIEQIMLASQLMYIIG